MLKDSHLCLVVEAHVSLVAMLDSTLYPISHIMKDIDLRDLIQKLSAAYEMVH